MVCEAYYIKLYIKQGMGFGDCPAGYLVHSFPKSKNEFYKAFLSFSVETAQGEVWGEEANRLMTFQ